ncbi:hypothetical protein OHT68_01555 [Streptomyces canus]|uniref:hypothetical protein n=1 Tax=Streptomyces canus TaxID=58343 RepID=UPI002E2BCB4D|nr:hypothetical protein [Streptomyces canus]
MRELERITARRGELDTLAGELAKQLQEVQAERDRAAEQDAAAVAPTPARVAGRAVLLIPYRSEVGGEAALPDDYRTILAIVRDADGPVQVRAVGERLGLDTLARGKLEPLRAKMTRLADRGWLHKRGDGRFTARL